jgi:endogenous inhibitor of DNA gyrase (YacG/DUF329 family)
VERTCPLCRKTFIEVSPEPFRPFCSARCKREDLANWLSGAYSSPRELLPEDLEHLSEEEQSELFQRISQAKGFLA